MGRPLVACVKCGYWAERKPRALLQECKGFAAPRSEGSQALRRLAMGQHPQHDRGHLVGPVVALQWDHQEAASAALSAFLQKGRRSGVRAVPGHEAGGHVRTASPGVPGAAGVDERPTSPEERGPTAKSRLDALRTRVAAKAAGSVV